MFEKKKFPWFSSIYDSQISTPSPFSLPNSRLKHPATHLTSRPGCLTRISNLRPGQNSTPSGKAAHRGPCPAPASCGTLLPRVPSGCHLLHPFRSTWTPAHAWCSMSFPHAAPARETPTHGRASEEWTAPAAQPWWETGPEETRPRAGPGAWAQQWELRGLSWLTSPAPLRRCRRARPPPRGKRLLPSTSDQNKPGQV